MSSTPELLCLTVLCDVVLHAVLECLCAMFRMVRYELLCFTHIFGDLEQKAHAMQTRRRVCHESFVCRAQLTPQLSWVGNAIQLTMRTCKMSSDLASAAPSSSSCTCIRRPYAHTWQWTQCMSSHTDTCRKLCLQTAHSSLGSA